MIINPYTYNPYLLDTYTNAVAAYSVRRLRSGYSGKVVNVRRTIGATSVFADVSFYNNTITMDSAVTITTGSSSATTLGEFCAKTGYSNPDGIAANQSLFVNTWYDQTTNGRNFGQSTASVQPRLVNAGNFETDGNHVCVNSDLGTTYYLDYGTGFTATTIFGVARVTTQNTINYVTGGTGLFMNGTFAGVNGIGGADSAGTIRSLTGEDLLRHLAYWNLKSSKLYAANNGAAESDLGSFNVASQNITRLFGRTNVGTSVNFRGKIQEFIFFNSDETNNKTGIEANINTFYGIY